MSPDELRDQLAVRVRRLEDDVANTRNDVAGVLRDLASVKSDVTNLRALVERLGPLNEKTAALVEKVHGLDEDIRRVELDLRSRLEGIAGLIDRAEQRRSNEQAEAIRDSRKRLWAFIGIGTTVALSTVATLVITLIQTQGG